jgi:hypothetical protein
LFELVVPYCFVLAFAEAMLPPLLFYEAIAAAYKMDFKLFRLKGVPSNELLVPLAATYY